MEPRVSLKLIRVWRAAVLAVVSAPLIRQPIANVAAASPWMRHAIVTANVMKVGNVLIVSDNLPSEDVQDRRGRRQIRKKGETRKCVSRIRTYWQPL